MFVFIDKKNYIEKAFLLWLFMWIFFIIFIEMEKPGSTLWNINGINKLSILGKKSVTREFISWEINV